MPGDKEDISIALRPDISIAVQQQNAGYEIGGRRKKRRFSFNQLDLTFSSRFAR
jgi:hypothetical protein